MPRITELERILKFVPRSVFDGLVMKHEADRSRKSFSSWQLLVSLTYAQLSGASSLRTLEASFNHQPLLNRRRLGIEAIRRSTLSDALAKWSEEVFKEMAEYLMKGVNRKQRRSGQALLYLLDSTSISLKGRGFDEWTAANRTRPTQGVKLHVVTGQGIPLHYQVTPPNVNDISAALTLPLEPKAVYVFDKGYCDYRWWHTIDQEGSHFVTRFKRNACLKIEAARPIPADEPPLILTDELVRLANTSPGGRRRNPYRHPLRRIAVARPGQTPLILATNDLDSPAAVIAQHYKDRWGIELFFKWMKQHLFIKSFLGRSKNAVRLQIAVALISFLILSLYRHAHHAYKSLWLLLAQLRTSLFQASSLSSCPRRRRSTPMTTSPFDPFTKEQL